MGCATGGSAVGQVMDDFLAAHAVHVVHTLVHRYRQFFILPPRFFIKLYSPHHHAGHEAAVSDVVHMGGKVITAVALGDESTQLDVFDGYLFASYATGQDTLQLIVAGIMSQSGNLPDFFLVEVVVQSCNIP